MLVGALLVVSFVSVTALTITDPGRTESERHHIVAPRRTLSAGEEIELKIEPPLPPIDVHWGSPELVGCHSAIFFYHAPYVIPAGTPPATVRVSLPAERDSIQLELTPSSFPGATECLGPAQTFSTENGDLLPHQNIVLTEKAVVIRGDDPRYPRAAFVRGLEDTIVVKVLVCRMGRALDAFVQPFCDDHSIAIPVDPKLGDAAVDVVMQMTFEPQRDSAGPIAAWTYQYVIFRR